MVVDVDIECEAGGMKFLARWRDCQIGGYVRRKQLRLPPLLREAEVRLALRFVLPFPSYTTLFYHTKDSVLE